MGEAPRNPTASQHREIPGSPICRHWPGPAVIAQTSSQCTLAYKYDAASLRARIVHPDLAWFETSRDALGRPYWLASSDNHSCFYGSWRAEGLPGSQGRCNGASTWVSRDGIGRLDGLGHYYGTGGSGDVT